MKLLIFNTLFSFLTFQSFAGKPVAPKNTIYTLTDSSYPVHKAVSNNLTIHFSDTSKATKENKDLSCIETNFNEIENKNALDFKYAIILDIPVEEVNNSSLFQFIDEWYGVKYHFGGTTKKGIDCSSFSQHLLKEVYNIDAGRVVSMQFKETEKVNENDLLQGDLIFFHTTRPGLSHVGVYLGNHKFIHASVTRGVVIDDLNTSYYRKAYRCAGRIHQSNQSQDLSLGYIKNDK